MRNFGCRVRHPKRLPHRPRRLLAAVIARGHQRCGHLLAGVPERSVSLFVQTQDLQIQLRRAQNRLVWRSSSMCQQARLAEHPSLVCEPSAGSRLQPSPLPKHSTQY